MIPAVTFRTIFLPLAATALLAGCGASSDKSVAGNTFPDTERESFLAGCEDRGAPFAACECIISAVEKRWSFDEFEAMMKQVQAGAQVPAEFIQLSAGCAKPA